MVSAASGGTADQIAARILFKVLRPGSGIPARYSSILLGASSAFGADLRVMGFARFMGQRYNYFSFRGHFFHLLQVDLRYTLKIVAGPLSRTSLRRQCRGGSQGS